MTTRRDVENALAGGLAGALGRAAEALRLTAVRLSRVEGAVGEIMQQAGNVSASHFANLQELDLSVQEVAALAEFIDQLARRTPVEIAVDLAGAAQPVLLHDLAVFLGRPAVARTPAHDEDIDIFFAHGG
jgi:hypothetical protein